ncbi:MAG: sodium:proton antiporter [Candidatus Krumholzibacteriota bacterium]|nr:sodium:proton antiporter [Candidatus Krumholzibacteriota bacterium]
MIKRIIAFHLVAAAALLLWGIVDGRVPPGSLGGVGRDYVERTPGELGAANVVTGIVVTWRGLDTLGEVTVLFLAAAGVALVLRRREGAAENAAAPEAPRRDSSEILETGSAFLVPAIVMFGVYIFLNGHLTPGGGFQGGAVVASAVLLLFLVHPGYRTAHRALEAVESVSGALYVAAGLLGLLLAGGFLDNRFLPPGVFGTILSAGAIPVIYTLIGLKVGAELAGILDSLRGGGE